MRLIDRLLSVTKSNCEACGKRLRHKLPAVVALSDPHPGQRRTIDTTVLACADGAKVLLNLSIRERVLAISRVGPEFVCPAQRNKANPTRSPKVELTSGLKPAKTSLTPAAAWPFPAGSLPPRQSSPTKTNTSKSAKSRTTAQVKHDDFIEPDAPPPEFSVERVREALNNHRLDVLQITQLLDRAKVLGINDDLYEALSIRKAELLKQPHSYAVTNKGEVIKIDC